MCRDTLALVCCAANYCKLQLQRCPPPFASPRLFIFIFTFMIKSHQEPGPCVHACPSSRHIDQPCPSSASRPCPTPLCPTILFLQYLYRRLPQKSYTADKPRIALSMYRLGSPPAPDARPQSAFPSPLGLLPIHADDTARLIPLAVPHFTAPCRGRLPRKLEVKTLHGLKRSEALIIEAS